MAPRVAARAPVAGTDPTVGGMAGRYASALFDVAREEKRIAEVEGDLKAFEDMLNASPDLERLVKSPVIAAQDQMKALAVLLARAGISGLTANFLLFLARNRRLFALPAMIAAFRVLLASERGEVSAEVTTAHALKPEQMELLKDTLRSAFAKDVRVSASVDQNLLGGMIVKVGNKMIDSSLRTKLNSLKIVMKGTS